MALDKPTPHMPRCLANDPEHVQDPQTRAIILKLAEDYEKLAQRAQTRKGGKQHS